MLNGTSVALFLSAVSMVVVTSACSSGDEDDKKQSGNPGPALNLGGSGSVANLGGAGALLNPGQIGGEAGSFDGGTIPITPEQVEGMRNQACTGWASEGETIPSVLELVIDVSSSMTLQAPGGSESKWDVTRKALLDAVVGGLPASVAVGALFYPNTRVALSTEPQDISNCVNTNAMIPIDVLGASDAAHRNLIRQEIEDVQPLLSTPTHDAYKYALNQGLMPTQVAGQKYMLLITDGAPTLLLGCMNPNGDLSEVDPQPIVDEISEAAKQGIKTFLIGSPGSEPNREWMSQAAVIGGTAKAGCSPKGPDWCHMDMTTAPNFSDALRAGLAHIAGQIAPCSYSFAAPPKGETIDSGKINVLVTSDGKSEIVVRDDVGDCAEGWQLTDDQKILLCPTTCDRVQADPNVDVEVLFGCSSVSGPVR